MFNWLQSDRFPFDWKNPVGFLVAVIIQYILDLVGFAVVLGSLSFGVSVYLFTLSVNKDIRGILKTINRKAKSTQNQQNIIHRTRVYIQLHSDLKQLSAKWDRIKNYEELIKCVLVFSRFLQDFVEICQPFLVALFLWGSITICCTMLMIQIELVEYFWKILEKFDVIFIILLFFS